MKPGRRPRPLRRQRFPRTVSPCPEPGAPRMFIVPFKQVDVFTTHAFGGNPVAVVLDGEGLNATQMQHIAAWTNLSETAFVLNPTQAGASYRVRIFTPKSELPFAGHPSVGTAHALIEAGLAPHPERGLVQECAAGLLPISVREAEGRRCVSIRTPVARQEVPTGFDPALIDVALAGLTRGALPPQSWNNGPRWWLAEVANEAELRAHAPDFEAIAALCRASGATGLAAFAETGREQERLAVRAWCPADGIPEDPVTGSANGSIGALLHAQGRAAPGSSYIASQGRELGRDGRIEVGLREDGVWIGGSSVTVIDGMIRFDE